MADFRIHDLDAAPGSPNDTDLIEGERDPSGTPASEKLTWNQVATSTAFASRYHAIGGTDIPVADGGTGASDAAGARSNLGLGALAVKATVNNDDWSGTDLAVANGGTGASTASGARTNLELGTLATSSTVNNTNWSGVALAVTNGGTGAPDAPTARVNLGLGSLATASNVNNSNWSGTALAVANGGTGATTAATARTNLGLGTLATQSTVTQKFEKVYSFPGQLAIDVGATRMYFKRAATLTNVYASVATAPTGASIRVDVNKNGTTIFTTQSARPDIATGTNVDLTATPAVTSVSAGEYVTVDVDAVGSSGTEGADLTVVIEYTELIS